MNVGHAAATFFTFFPLITRTTRFFSLICLSLLKSWMLSLSPPHFPAAIADLIQTSGLTTQPSRPGTTQILRKRSILACLSDEKRGRKKSRKSSGRRVSFAPDAEVIPRSLLCCIRKFPVIESAPKRNPKSLDPTPLSHPDPSIPFSHPLPIAARSTRLAQPRPFPLPQLKTLHVYDQDPANSPPFPARQLSPTIPEESENSLSQQPREVGLDAVSPSNRDCSPELTSMDITAADMTAMELTGVHGGPSGDVQSCHYRPSYAPRSSPHCQALLALSALAFPAPTRTSSCAVAPEDPADRRRRVGDSAERFAAAPVSSTFFYLLLRPSPPCLPPLPAAQPAPPTLPPLCTPQAPAPSVPAGIPAVKPLQLFRDSAPQGDITAALPSLAALAEVTASHGATQQASSRPLDSFATEAVFRAVHSTQLSDRNGVRPTRIDPRPSQPITHHPSSFPVRTLGHVIPDQRLPTSDPPPSRRMTHRVPRRTLPGAPLPPGTPERSPRRCRHSRRSWKRTRRSILPQGLPRAGAGAPPATSRPRCRPWGTSWRRTRMLRRPPRRAREGDGTAATSRLRCCPWGSSWRQTRTPRCGGRAQRRRGCPPGGSLPTCSCRTTEALRQRTSRPPPVPVRREERPQRSVTDSVSCENGTP